MSEIFGVRSLIYWWGVLTATVFVRDWLFQLGNFFKTSDTFSPDRIPFSLLPTIDNAIKGVADYIHYGIKFDPNAVLIQVGTTIIRNYVLAILFGLICIIFAALLVRRALRSHLWFDDFVAIFVMYAVLRIVGHITSLTTAIPLANQFRVFADSQEASYIILMILLLFLTFFGEGFQSKRAFWRAVIAIFVLSLFMFPREVSARFGDMLNALALFGAGLLSKDNLAFAIAWGVIGMLLALYRLATPEFPAMPSAPKPSGGGQPAAGEGGGLKWLRRFSRK
ncbi:MAG: hypothetical protein N2559_00545 [Anaerolineae bacterium]|nr:hypothetical protein [Anaerolineae bacterium]